LSWSILIQNRIERLYTLELTDSPLTRVAIRATGQADTGIIGLKEQAWITCVADSIASATAERTARRTPYLALTDAGGGARSSAPCCAHQAVRVPRPLARLTAGVTGHT